MTRLRIGKKINNNKNTENGEDDQDRLCVDELSHSLRKNVLL